MQAILFIRRAFAERLLKEWMRRKDYFRISFCSKCLSWFRPISEDTSYLTTYIHTYIISDYKPSVRIIDLVSYTTYVVCVNFIHKCRDLQFKVDSEQQIFWKRFHGNFYLILRVFARNLLTDKRRRNTYKIWLVV